jgi:hypothetical protein
MGYKDRVTISRPSLPSVRPRAMAAGLAVAATLAMAACGGSSSPLATKPAATTTSAPAAATTVAPTTAVPATTVAPTTTPPTSAPATTTPPTTSSAPTTQPASGGGTVTAFCAALVAHAQSLVKNGHALETLKVDSKPTAAFTRELEAVTSDLDSLVAPAPSAIKPEVIAAARGYATLTAAFKTGNQAKSTAAVLVFLQTKTISQVFKVDAYETAHCEHG